MTQVLCFAYGSNMSVERMTSRVSSACFVGLAYLKNYKILFNKRSIDGSGKANLIGSTENITWGVLYKIHEDELDELDRIEGGYKQTAITIQQDNDDARECITYTSSNLTNDLRAYEWYKELVLLGAKENNLPPEYILYLENLPAKPDNRKSGVG